MEKLLILGENKLNRYALEHLFTWYVLDVAKISLINRLEKMTKEEQEREISRLFDYGLCAFGSSTAILITD